MTFDRKMLRHILSQKLRKGQDKSRPHRERQEWRRNEIKFQTRAVRRERRRAQWER